MLTFRLTLLCLLAAAGTASAIPLVGTNGTTLYKFDSPSPGTVTTVAISGLVSGDSLVGLECRPSTGQLYGIGNGRIYTLNPTTGAASNVGVAKAVFALSGGIAATGIPPSEDQEAAVLAAVPAAAYAAIVRGGNNGTGVGLVEVYALD